MAFLCRFSNLLKQSGSKHVSIGSFSSNSPLFQSIRSMSSAKLFIGGLFYATNEIGLKEAFQQYGEVIDVKVMSDRESGRSRGFGFVSYTSADAANSALQDMDGKELHGRRIRVSVAQERPRPSFGGGGYGSPGGGYGGAGGYGGGGGGGYGGGGSNIGGYGGGNQNAGGGQDLFSGVLGGGGVAGASTGGNDGGSDGNLKHVSEDDAEENHGYANTLNK